MTSSLLRTVPVIVMSLAFTLASCQQVKQAVQEGAENAGARSSSCRISDDDLIQNPGAEQPLNGDDIPYWTKAEGENWTYRTESPLPQSGSAYFFPGKGARAELYQDVDVSQFASAIDAGRRQFSFTGCVRAYGQSPPDDAQIMLEYRDTSGKVLDSYDSGRHSNTNAWQKVSHVQAAPANTRTIRVRLVSTRNEGSNNDGYFDNLSLE